MRPSERLPDNPRAVSPLTGRGRPGDDSAMPIHIVLDVDARGDGVVVAADGRELVVPGALPGDRAEVFSDGRPPRITERAPRTPADADLLPVCPHRRCPGCPLAALPYPQQLEAKRRQVARALDRHLAPVPCPPVLPVRPSPALAGYRASAKLALTRAGTGVHVGIYARGSHRVVDLPGCPVHHPLVASGVRALRSLLRQAPGLVGDGPGGGWLRYAAFQASVAEEALLVTVVTRSGEGEGLLRSLAVRLRERVPRLTGVVWNVNPTEGNEIFGLEWRELSGRPWIRERFGPLELRASAGSFLQANRAQAAWAYRTAREWLAPDPAEDALDLYCGVGGLALTVAGTARRVVGVEANPRAVSDARWSAAHLGTAGASFTAGDVDDGVSTLATEGFRPGVVTLNPSRKGADPGTLRVLRELAPRAIAYLSCNPETLARDLAGLAGGDGYRLTRVQPVDFFPHTGHVETLALLERP